MLGVYGFIIGINIALILFPIIESIEVFSSVQIADLAQRGFLPNWSGHFVNLLLRWFMIFVAFGSIETITNVISVILGFKINDKNNVYGERDKKKGKIKRSGEASVIERGDEVIKGSKEFIASATSLISGKFLVDGAENVVSSAASLIPGNAMVHAAQSHLEFKRGQNAISDQQGELENAMRNGVQANYKSGATPAEKAAEDARVAGINTQNVSAETQKLTNMMPKKK